MNICCSVYNKNESNRDAEYRKLQTKVSIYELLESSMPVFVGAGISSSVRSIVAIIVGENISAEVALMFLFALAWYFFGKYSIYMLTMDQIETVDTSFFNMIRKYKLRGLLISSAMETGGFAFKEFFIVYSFKFFYDEYGLGSAYSGWFLALILSVISIILSDNIQNHYLNIEDVNMNKLLLSFDAICSSVPLAYVLTVLLGLSATELGFSYTHEKSFLYTFDSTFDYDSTADTQTAEYLLYLFIVTVVVTLVQYTEFEYRVAVRRRSRMRFSMRTLHKAMNELAEEEKQKTGETKSNKDTNTQEKTRGFYNFISKFIFWSEHIQSGFLELWNSFWGYFSGMAWFILLIDNFMLPTIDEDSEFLQNYITLLIIVILITWQAPEILANIKILQEKETKKLANNSVVKEAFSVKGEIRKEKSEFQNSVSPKAEFRNSDRDFSDISLRTDSEARTSRVNAKSGQNSERSSILNTMTNKCAENSLLYRRYRRLKYFLLKTRMKQNGVVMISIRLVVGFSWEVWVAETFDILIDTTQDPAAAVFVVIFSLCFVISIVLAIHLYMKDWNGDNPNSDETDSVDVEDEETQKPTIDESQSPYTFEENPLEGVELRNSGQPPDKHRSRKYKNSNNTDGEIERMSKKSSFGGNKSSVRDKKSSFGDGKTDINRASRRIQESIARPQTGNPLENRRTISADKKGFSNYPIKPPKPNNR